MIKIINTVCLVFLVSFLSFGQTYNSLDANVKNVIDSTYKSLLKKNKVVGTSIAIVQNGEIVYATGYGFQNQTDSVKADENTIYRIGSCTKSFTALSIMQLQEQQKLDINQAIQNYVKALNIKSRFNTENPILIKDILTHSSGLPSDIINGFFCDNPPSIDWLIEKLNQCTMAAPAGYQHSYSNTGYSLLGELIEKVSNTDYESYLKANIFEPLGMTSSYVTNSGDLIAQTSKGYMGEDEIDETMIRDQAAGLIHSNVIDMANYIKMYLGNGQFNQTKVADPTSIDEMEKDALTNLVLQTGKQWGYGLYADNLSITNETDTIETRMIGHGGDTWAFHADFQYIPELNIGAVILTNTNKGAKIASAKKLLSIYLKETEKMNVKLLKKEVNPSLPKDKLCKASDIIGLYHLGGMTINIENPKKIKLKQGSSKIIMKPKNDSLRYAGKVKLFSIIPVKIKHQEFKFVSYNDAIYMKVIHMNNGNEDYVSVRSEPKKIPET